MTDPRVAYRASPPTGTRLMNIGPAQLVCAALVLSVLTVLFRIALIW